MRKLTLVAAAVAALAGAGIAVAHGLDGTPGVSAVNATFTATTAGSTDTRTCKSAAGKTIASTRATYTGSASGSPDLTGPVTIDARSTIDTTSGAGVLSGTLRIASAHGKTEAHFTAVVDHGAVAGTATGHGAPHTQLFANISAGYSATGGFTNGKIGGGTAGGSAVELAGKGCGSPEPSSPPHTGKSAEGPITAVSSASITVGGLTCVVPATSLRVDVAFQYSVGDRVKITCSDVSGTLTLVKIEKKGR